MCHLCLERAFGAQKDWFSRRRFVDLSAVAPRRLRARRSVNPQGSLRPKSHFSSSRGTRKTIDTHKPPYCD